MICDATAAAGIQKETEKFQVIVLGAGISGLVSASVLLKQGNQRVLVVDEYPNLGGNHIDCSIGKYTYDIGSFIFQDDSPLLTHLPELLPLYVHINPTWGRLNPQGIVTNYPISVKDDFIIAGPVEWLRIFLSLLFARIFLRRLRNAKDFAQYWIGARLLRRSGLEDYMRRFYGLRPEMIDLRFAEKRMLWIKESASLKSLLRRWIKPAQSLSIANKQLARPKEGFSFLYQSAARRLEEGGVTFLLGTKMHKLQKEDGLFFLEAGQRKCAAARVVSTIPLERIQNLCGLAHAKKFQTVTLLTLFFSFAGDRGFKHSILYNFSYDGSWKRLTVYSDFYGPSCGREFFAVEVNSDHVQGSVENAVRDFRHHVKKNGLFAGDLKLEGSHSTSNAYPVYARGAAENAEETISALRKFGIESFGRQGGFDYQPTARVSALKAEAALEGRLID
jgi:protoporphyrinogen oxidase